MARKKRGLLRPSKKFPGFFESGRVSAIAYTDVEGEWLHVFKKGKPLLLTNRKGQVALILGPQTRFTERGFVD